MYNPPPPITCFLWDNVFSGKCFVCLDCKPLHVFPYGHLWTLAPYEISRSLHHFSRCLTVPFHLSLSSYTATHHVIVSLHRLMTQSGARYSDPFDTLDLHVLPENERWSWCFFLSCEKVERQAINGFRLYRLRSVSAFLPGGWTGVKFALGAKNGVDISGNFLGSHNPSIQQGSIPWNYLLNNW